MPSPSLRQVNHSMRAGKYGGAARRKHKSTNRESKEQVSMKWREEGWKGEKIKNNDNLGFPHVRHTRSAIHTQSDRKVVFF